MIKTVGHFTLCISWFCLLHLFIFTQPVEAANRNEVLLNLKDGFNGPVLDQSSFIGMIYIVIAIALVMLIVKIQSSRDKKALRRSRNLNLQKQSNQRSLNQQKRNWFRLKTNAKFLWIPAEMESTVKDNKYRIDQLIDLSGGGLSFSTTYEIKSNEEITLRLFIGLKDPLYINGKVVRVKKEDTHQIVSIEFIGIRDGYRDRIVAFLLNNQRNAIQEEKQEDPNSIASNAPLDPSQHNDINL